MNRKSITGVFLTAGAVLLGAQYGRTCMSGILYGVHFRSNKVDFGAPPVRFSNPYLFLEDDKVGYRKPDMYRAGSIEWNDDLVDDDTAAKQKAEREKLRTDLLVKAAASEKARNYVEALNAYKQLNSKGLIPPAFAYRRSLLLTEYSGAPDLQPFLAATALGSVRPLPSEATSSEKLRPFVAYEAASRAYDAGNLEQASKLYAAAGESYPQSKLADSAFFMAGVSALRMPNPDPAFAGKELNFLMEHDLESPLRFAALGWQGRVAFLNRDYVGATGLYRKQITGSTSADQKLKAADSIIECGRASKNRAVTAEGFLRRFSIVKSESDAMFSVDELKEVEAGFSPEEAKKFGDVIQKDPSLTAAYLQARLEMTITRTEDRERLIQIAASALEEGPSREQRGILLARSAQAHYLNGDYSKCASNAKKATTLLPEGSDEWALGQYLLASSLKFQNPQDSATAYQTLVAKAPKSYLAPGARETLAFLYDREGKLSAALDEFYEMVGNHQSPFPQDRLVGLTEYFADIAYLLDVKMSPNQILGYIASHPGNPNRDEWRYTLGFRYLRSGKYAEASKTFAKISRAVREKFAQMGKDSIFDEASPLQDPLQTANDLTSLQTKMMSATGSEAIAQAMYKLASYYYERRNLLLYNAPLWQCERVNSIDQSWSASNATKRDNDALENHQFEHDCASQALKLCESIVARYPHSKVAAQAMYRAACAAKRLANMNDWWKWEADRIKLNDKALKYMATVAVLYPKSPLVKSSKKYAEAYRQDLRDSQNNGLYGKSPSVYHGDWN